MLILNYLLQKLLFLFSSRQAKATFSFIPYHYGCYSITANSDNAVAAIDNIEKHLYGLQFHPEVAHTEHGSKIIGNFLFQICRCRGAWTPKSFIQESVKKIREQVGSSKVVLGLSGGVDSSVAAVLLQKAIGKRLTCIFVDTGLLRKDEGKRTNAQLCA